MCACVLQELVHCGRRDAQQWAQQTGLAALASSSSVDNSSSMEGSRYSPLSSTDSGVWLPQGSSSSAAAAVSSSSSGGGGGVSGDDAPVGTSLIGLVRTLVAHSTRKQ
jgi:hypothetical protein